MVMLDGAWRMSHPRSILAVIIGGLLLTGCSSREEVAVPGVEPFKTVLPNVQLGVKLADWQAARPGLGVKGDGTYWEEFRELEVVYGFWPKEADRPPPLSARLMSIEGRRQVYDSVGLWPEWQRAVAQAGEALSAEPTCTVLTGGRTRMVRADYAGPVPISVIAELWRGEDGQEYGAFLITRARLGADPASDDTGMEPEEIDCRSVSGGAANDC